MSQALILRQDTTLTQKMVRDISFCRIRYWSAKKLLYIYWIKASTLMLGMDLLENSNCIRVSLHKKTQFCKTEIRVLSNKSVTLHLQVVSTASNKDSSNVLKQSPEDRNVENNSDICDFVSSIVIDGFLVHHKIRTLELTHKFGTLSKIQSSQNQ